MNDMTDEQTTDSFIKAIEQLEYIAKSHHDAIVRVRELHQEIDGIGVKACAVCIDDRIHWTEQAEYPCPTIKALDGDK